MTENTTAKAVLSSMEEAHADRNYLYFVYSSLATLAATFLIVFIPRVFIYICRAMAMSKKPKSAEKQDHILIQPSVYSNIQVSQFSQYWL